jgi:hypothetical protein
MADNRCQRSALSEYRRGTWLQRWPSIFDFDENSPIVCRFLPFVASELMLWGVGLGRTATLTGLAAFRGLSPIVRRPLVERQGARSTAAPHRDAQRHAHRHGGHGATGRPKRLGRGEGRAATLWGDHPERRRVRVDRPAGALRPPPRRLRPLLPVARLHPAGPIPSRLAVKGRRARRGEHTCAMTEGAASGAGVREGP